MSHSIKAQNCRYRAEGNAAIVVRLIKEGTVLRLTKQDNETKVSPSAEEVFKELENEIKIINCIMKPILGEVFVNTPLLVFVRAEEIRIINDAVNRFRPAHRMHRSLKEEDTYAFMFPDYCSLPQSLTPIPTCGSTLTIEIKPKQGFMKEECLSSTSSPLPVSICRFCMMQGLKLKRGKISSRSGYCPLDLFSGCYSRMLHALKMLISTPQNNFRIFMNEKLVYSEEERNNLCELLSDFIPSEQTRYLDYFCDLIVRALVKPFTCRMGKNPVPPKKKFSSQYCINSYTLCSEHDFCRELPQDCILGRILSAQLLDDLNIGDLYQLYLGIKGSNDKCSDSIGCYSRLEIPTHIGERGKNSKESECEYASRKVWEFLVALTAKDCSIMITLKHLIENSSNAAQSGNVISDSYGNLYAFSISIADLDSKSLNKVEKVYSDVTSMLDLISV